MNGLRSGLVIAGLASAGLLLTMPGAQAAPVDAERMSIPVCKLSQDFAQLPRLDAWYARRGGYLAGDQVASVMPRGGDGQAQAPTQHEVDWIPLLIVGGLLAIGVGTYLLYAGRRPA